MKRGSRIQRGKLHRILDGFLLRVSHNFVPINGVLIVIGWSCKWFSLEGFSDGAKRDKGLDLVLSFRVPSGCSIIPHCDMKSPMAKGFKKPLLSSAIFRPSFSAAKTFYAARSISSFTLSILMISGFAVITHYSLRSACLTAS